MKLDDLMAVWRSQDVAPLHGFNETLLRLALRQEEAKQRTQRRWESGISNGTGAFLAVALVVCVGVMIYRAGVAGLAGWDVAIPIVGAATILLWPGLLRRSHRAQALREQRFGESLREQLGRQIAQLDYQARRIASPAHHLGMNLPALGWTLAFFFTIVRINGKPFSAAWTDARLWGVFGGSFVFCILLVALSIALQRRWVRRDLMPRKRRLEMLLQELEDRA